jgi:phenylalanine ammonia-lyase
MTLKNPWLPTIQKQTAPKEGRLFCFPFAGGSSFAYRSFESHISPGVEVHTIELPGRGTRADEALCENIEQLIPAIAEAIRPHLDVPFAFFGHSMGALIAFELARYLESHNQKKADYLFLSAMRAPHLPSRFPDMAPLPSGDLLHWIRKLEELPETILKSPEMLSLFLRIMRADLALCETCVIPISAHTTIPIIAFAGSEDIFSPVEDVRQWEQYTKNHFRFEIFQGSHLFCKTSGKEVAQAINKIMKKIELNGTQLTLDQLTAAAIGTSKVSITRDPAALARVQSSFQKMQQSVASGETIYGVTTAFGGMANRLISHQDAAQMQQNMLWVHKTGLGSYLPKQDVRAAMILRANSHIRGNSSIRLPLIERLVTFVNEGITPCVPELGSIGASGDLVPLSYIAGALTGHGAGYQVEMNGEVFPAAIALKRLNLAPLSLEPKEALAMLNGTSMMTAIGANCVKEAEDLLILALHIQAMLIQGLHGTPLSYHPYLHQIKPHPGQLWVAEKMLCLLKGSRLVRQNDGFDRNSKHDLVQDRYSLRCLPQYLGPIFENLWSLKRQLEIEMNSSNDNPLMNPDTGEIFYGGNFLGEYIGIGMDQLRMMLSLTAKSVDVQIALLVEPRFNNGLPPCLVGNPEVSINMGLKALQIVGNSILPLIEFYGHSIADRFPTHAEQFNQNINSQGFNSANLSRKSIELFRKYLSLSLLFAVQAIDLRSHKEFSSYEGHAFLSPATLPLYLRVREITQRPSIPQKPWLWNDGEHKLDEQVSKIDADLTSPSSKLKKSLCLD